jgi:hypothetical protein
MEDKFRIRWRSFVPLILTAIIVGSALGFAFA